MSNYREPGVSVEIIERSSGAVPPPGKLPPCVVGPGFQIVIREFAGIHDGTNATVFSYPDQLDYSTVDVENVEVFITNAADGVTYSVPEESNGITNWVATVDSLTMIPNVYSDVASGADGVVEATDLNVFVVETSLAATRVLAGDVLYIPTAGPLQGEHDIAGVDDNGNLVMQDPFTGDATGLDWEIRRYLVGSVFISYRALRGDLVANRTWYDSTEDVIIAAGGPSAITPENPLFYGAYITTLAGGGTWVAGVNDMYASETPERATPSAWASAFNYLQDFNDIYSYVILTQNDQIIALAQTFVDWMSLPENKSECVAMCSTQRKTDEEAIGTATATARGEAQFAADGSTFSVADIDGISYSFVTYGCHAMGYVEVTYNGEVYLVRAQKVDDDLVTVLSPSSVPTAIRGAAGSSTTLGWTWRFVNDYYDSAAEAQHYKEYAESFGDKRVRLAFPATVGVEISGVTVSLPSFYWWAYRAGLIYVNRNPSTPYTNTRAGFFSRSFLPFRKRSYLNTVASGGWEIIMQDSTNAPLYCRHQLTTDMSHPARAEQSVVHAVDHAAKYIRSVLEPNIGRYNGSNAYLTQVKTLLSGVRASLVQKIQSLSRMSTITLEFDAIDPRNLGVEVEIGARYPVNNIDILMLVF